MPRRVVYGLFFHFLYGSSTWYVVRSRSCRHFQDPCLFLLLSTREYSPALYPSPPRYLSCHPDVYPTLVPLAPYRAWHKHHPGTPCCTPSASRLRRIPRNPTGHEYTHLQRAALRRI